MKQSPLREGPQDLRRISIGLPESARQGALAFEDLIVSATPLAQARCQRGGMVDHAFIHPAPPRSLRACRGVTAPNGRQLSRIVAQNLYARYERTLGVMPLYHTMAYAH